jgi:hypothetical protein
LTHFSYNGTDLSGLTFKDALNKSGMAGGIATEA